MKNLLIPSIPAKTETKKLYQWFQKNRRDLPFRKDRNFYKVWVSEVMLQQTRVAAVLKSYDLFMKRFPELNDLAMAAEEEVLALWKGLGYYRRARLLWQGAKKVYFEYSGNFPQTKEEALKIPGVGDYTASAILSLAYDRPYAVFDGNVFRVLSRMYFQTDPYHVKELKKIAERWCLEASKPSLHNESIMELGALVCMPFTVLCDECPLKNVCRACQNLNLSQVVLIPESGKRKMKNYILEIVLVRKKEQILVIKDKKSYFFKDMYFFPYRLLNESGDVVYDGIKKHINVKQSFHSVCRHTITDHKLQIKIAEGSLVKKIEFSKFSPVETIEEVCVSSITRKILNSTGNHTDSQNM